MNEYKIKEESLNKVLQYLASRPWAESNHLILELRKAELIKENKEDKNVQEGK